MVAMENGGGRSQGLERLSKALGEATAVEPGGKGVGITQRLNQAGNDPLELGGRRVGRGTSGRAALGDAPDAVLRGVAIPDVPSASQ